VKAEAFNLNLRQRLGVDASCAPDQCSPSCPLLFSYAWILASSRNQTTIRGITFTRNLSHLQRKQVGFVERLSRTTEKHLNGWQNVAPIR
jgi:hypothetical protein